MCQACSRCQGDIRNQTRCLASRSLHSLAGAGMGIDQYSVCPAAVLKSSYTWGTGASGRSPQPRLGQKEGKSTVLADIWKTFFPTSKVDFSFHLSLILFI